MKYVRAGAVASALVVALGLSACAPVVPPTPSPTLVSTPAASIPVASPTPGPSSTTPGSSSTMPDACADLISAEELGAIVGLTVREVEWEEIERPVGAHPGDWLPGPIAQEASRGATERLDCMWWPEPAFGWNFSLHVMRIDAATRETLLPALRASSEYEESDVSGSPTFAHTWDNGLGSMWSSYAFIDDVWVAAVSATPADRLEIVMSVLLERIG